MADVFVSYAREDQARVAALVGFLESRAWSVFWDRDIPPGETWRSHIGAALEQARCVVVTWSEHSILSDWVIEEADEARERDILIPVLLDPVRPPRGFRSVQAANLIGWPAQRNDAALAAVALAVSELVQPTPQAAEAAQAETLESPAQAPVPALQSEVAPLSGAAGLATRPRGWHHRRTALGAAAIAAAVIAFVLLNGQLLWRGSNTRNSEVSTQSRDGFSSDGPKMKQASSTTEAPQHDTVHMPSDRVDEIAGAELVYDPRRTKVLAITGKTLLVQGRTLTLKNSSAN